MVFPTAAAMFVKRAPGVTVAKHNITLPPNTTVTPSAHCTIQLPSVSGLDTRSCQLMFDVSTNNGTADTFVLPRYGGQMLIDRSSIICNGVVIGGQTNQLLNVYNHIKQEYSAGVTDQAAMSVYGGGTDIPAAGAASAASFDNMGSYLPGNVTSYSGTAWPLSSQTTALLPAGGVNQLTKDANGNITYKNGLPQVVDIFNETLESVEPSILPTYLMNTTVVDVGFGSASCLVAAAANAAGSTPTYAVNNISLQCTVYELGQQYRDYNEQFIADGNLFECPFKGVYSFQGALQTGMDTSMQFAIGTQSLDMLMCCFMDSAYRAPGAVVPGLNSSKYFQMGKGTGVRFMNWSINGQQNPAFPVTPVKAWGQTSNDLGLMEIGRGTWKNLNSYPYYLTKAFVWAYSLQLPFAEALNRAISGLNTLSQNAQLALNVTADYQQVAAALEASYSCFPTVFAVTTQSLLIGAGGAVSVQV